MTREWMFSLVSTCQRFVCESTTVPLREVPDVARRAISGVPEPPTPAARPVMRAILVELATRWGYDRHRALRGLCPDAHCEPAALAHIAAHCQRHPDRPQDMFIAWAEEFCREVDLTHRECLARRVAVLIRESMTSRLNVRQIASDVSAHEATIRRAFDREFHMSLRDYHTNARIAYVEQLLRDSPRTKIEAVALQAGWHSKKDFYRAVLRTRGCTPGVLRARVTPHDTVPDR